MGFFSCCAVTLNVLCISLFLLSFTSLILFWVLRTGSLDYSEDATCPSLVTQDEEIIIADSNSVVLMQTYRFVIEQSRIYKPCGQGSQKYDVVLESLHDEYSDDTLIAKYESETVSTTSKLMSSGYFRDCDGVALYYVEFTNDEYSVNEGFSDESSQYLMTSATISTSEGVLQNYFEIFSDRMTAELYASDMTTVLATIEQYSEKYNDFVIKVEEGDNDVFDPEALFLIFGVWAFSEEKGATDLCNIVKLGSVIGLVISGGLSVLIGVITYSCCHYRRKERRMEV